MTNQSRGEIQMMRKESERVKMKGRTNKRSVGVVESQTDYKI
jgi:hypothetical protein